MLPVLGLTLKLCDGCLQQARFFTPLSFLGDLRHFPGLFNFLLHEAPACPVQKRERPFSFKCLNSRDTFWRGCFLLFLGEAVLGTFVALSVTSTARAQQGSDQLRTGMADTEALCPSSLWPPQHTWLRAGAAPGVAWQNLLHPCPKASSMQGEGSMCCTAVIHSQMEESTGLPLLNALLAQVGHSSTAEPHSSPESPPRFWISDQN